MSATAAVNTNTANVAATTNTCKDYIVARPYEWVSKDFDNRSQIRIWCLTRSDNDEQGISRQICLRIEDFAPTLRVELPTRIDGQFINWNDDSQLRSLGPILDGIGGKVKPIKRTVATKRRIYHYLPVTIITFHFRSDKEMWQYRKLIETPICIDKARGKYIQFMIWEGNITTVHKLSTQRNTGYTQWLQIDKSKCRQVDAESQITFASEEYVVPYEALTGVSEDKTTAWQVNPMTLTLDIECYSPNFNSIPKGIYADNVVTMNSLVFQLMYPDKADSHRQVKILQTIDECDEIPGAKVHFYNHEIKLILGMQEYIRKYNPFVVYTFNGFKFDFPYLDERRELFSVEKWNNLSCMQDEYSDTKISNMSWRSSAQQEVIIKSLEMEGRLSLDVYRIMRADYPQLPQHSLEALSRHYLKKGKHPVSAQEMFKIHEQSVKAAKSKDPRLIAAARKEVARVGDYCLQDSLLTFELPAKLNLFTALMEMSNIVCVPPSAIYTRGQQIRVRNQIYKEVFDKGFILNDPDVKIGKYAGGYVCPPVKGRHRNVMVFDFASLYPSIIRAYNMCYTTLVTDASVPDTDCHVIEWDEEQEEEETKTKKVRGPASSTGRAVKEPPKIIKIHHRYRFLKQSIRQGILPQICEKLVTKRRIIKKLMEDPNISDFMHSVYDQRQNALKICANSVYGFLGAQVMPLEAAASSVTAKGRILNFICQDYVKKYGGKVVYGDTDSIMVSLPHVSDEQTYYWGKKLAAELTDLFPDPLKLEFEKSYHVVIYFTKKRYAGIETKYYELSSVQQRTVRQTEIGYLHTFTHRDKKTAEVKEFNVISELADFKEVIAGMLVDETNNYELADYDSHTVKEVNNGYLHSLKKPQTEEERKQKKKEEWVHVLSQCQDVQQVDVVDKKKGIEAKRETGAKQETGAMGIEAKQETGAMGIEAISISKVITAVTGFAVTSNGEIDIDLKKVKHKGLPNTRRDRCPWAQEAFATSLRSALLSKGLDIILEQADTNVLRMMYGLVPFKELILTREVNNYKDTSNCPMKTFKAKQEERGHPLELGERAVYVFVDRVLPEDNAKQGYKMCLLADYVKGREQEPIDRIFYVEKQLCTPIQQLLEIVYGQELAAKTAGLGAFGYKPKGFFSTRMGINYITVWVKAIKRKNLYQQELLYDFDNGIIGISSRAVDNDYYWTARQAYLTRLAWLEEQNYETGGYQELLPELSHKRRALIHPASRVDYIKMLNKLDEVRAMTGVIREKKVKKSKPAATAATVAVEV